MSGTSSRRARRLGGALAIFLVLAAGPRAPSADPGDDEIARLLVPADTDPAPVKQFKETGRNPYNDDADAIAAGFTLARAVACTHCHGPDLSGLIGPNLTSGQWRYPRDATDTGMFQTIFFGTNGGMAAWGKLGSLTEDEILRIMAFVRSRYRGGSAGATRDEGR